MTLATYTYDPLDRLRLVDRGSTDQVRFRYVGLTTAVAQVLDHDAGTVSRNIATGWDGTRLADWTGAGSDLRIYGTNAHHDVTFTTGAAGTVTATARYDPWGTLASSSGTLAEFRFQASWFDTTTELAWVITRWYAPAQGRFISEDSLLGESARPASRHLYAYGEGEPVGRWDPDGRHWYWTRQGDTFESLSRRFYGTGALANRIRNGNPGGRITPRNLGQAALPPIAACIWIPFTQRGHDCLHIRGDSLQPGAVLWQRFDATVAFMAAEMKRNSAPMAGGVGVYLGGGAITAINDIAVLTAFGLRVMPGGSWDHKDILKRTIGHGAEFWLAVRDDPAPERLYFDVWSNIHYGFVGRAHGIPSWMLETAHQLPFAGLTDAADLISVRLGIRLWDQHHSISERLLRTAVLHALPAYRRSGVRNIVIPPLRP